MNIEIDTELVESFSKLPLKRQEQVLEYARWLRKNDIPLPRRLRRACSSTRRVQPARSHPCPQLERALQGLNCEKRLLIEEYAKALDAGRGVPGHALLRFAGTTPEDALRRMEQVIEEECERIDHDAWLAPAGHEPSTG
jgi:hypothetical protein